MSKDLTHYDQLYNQLLGELQLGVRQQTSKMDDDSASSLRDIMSKLTDVSNHLFSAEKREKEVMQRRALELEATNKLFIHEAQNGYLPNHVSRQRIPVSAAARPNTIKSVSFNSVKNRSQSSSNSTQSSSSTKSVSKSASSASSSDFFTFNLQDYSSTSSNSSSASAAKKLAAQKSMLSSAEERKRQVLSEASNSSQSDVEFKSYYKPSSSVQTARGKARSVPKFTTTIAVPKTHQHSEERTGLDMKRHADHSQPKEKEQSSNVPQRAIPQRDAKVEEPNFNESFVNKSNPKSKVSNAQKEASKYRPKSAQDGYQTSVSRSTTSDSQSLNNSDMSKIAQAGADLFGDGSDSTSSQNTSSSSHASHNNEDKSVSSKSSSWNPESYLKMSGASDDITIPKSTLEKQHKADQEALDKEFQRVSKNNQDLVEPDHKFEIQRLHIQQLSGQSVSKAVFDLLGKIADGSYGYQQPGLTFDDFQFVHRYYYGAVIKKTPGFKATREDGQRFSKIVDQLKTYIKKHPEIV